MGKDKIKPKNKRRSTWQGLEDLFGRKTVELVVKGKLIQLLGRKEKHRDTVGMERRHRVVKRSKPNPLQRIFRRGRPPLPEGIMVREKHKRDIGVGRQLLPGTQIDIFFSHQENREQYCHTHTIIYDDESTEPKNLLIYDRGLDKNRFLIAPGKKCKALQKGEDAEVGVFVIPDPQAFMDSVIKKHGGKIPMRDHPDWTPKIEEDKSNQAQELREVIQFEADQEWVDWRGDENPFPEYEKDTWESLKRAEDELMLEANVDYKFEGMRPNPDFHEP